MADPPLADPPGRSPPFLLLNQAKPPITRIIHFDGDDKVEFQVPVRSEDGGEELWRIFHIDYLFHDPTFTEIDTGALIPPTATMDDPARVIDFSLVRGYFNTNDRLPGCHQITMLVCHKTSLTADNKQCDPRKGLQDTAVATWWINYHPAGDANDLQNCPSSDAVQQ